MSKRHYWGRGSELQETRIMKCQAIRKYGGKCFRCGFSDYRALQFDHVDGDGKVYQVHNNYKYYLGIFLGTVKKELQLLCANCNWIKKIENAEGCRPDYNEFLIKEMEKDNAKSTRETLREFCWSLEVA